LPVFKKAEFLQDLLSGDSNCMKFTVNRLINAAPTSYFVSKWERFNSELCRITRPSFALIIDKL